MGNYSVAIELDSSELDAVEEIDAASYRRLAQLQENLESLRGQIRDKILQGIQDNRQYTQDAMKLVGELNATITNED